MTQWLLETLVWTAALIALVLFLRRPVARWFGPQFAYALWALPALRLVLPPIELPAWMRPAEAQAIAATAPASGAESIAADAINAALRGEGQGSAANEFVAAPATGLDLATLIEPALAIAIAVWLTGAAIFLIMRFSAYFRLRDELLEGSSELGRMDIGFGSKVRLIETAGTKAPLAFGVIDKVVALPQGFLALPDKRARDLALAHEMAHHQGRDLLANVLVQPLFALHWWNPLGRFGWLALRRDQEAACDARVMAAKPVEEREAYANLIVSFAAGPNIALAAPMACPVLGEKSIIHRLRSLKMSDTPKSRRLAGRLMLGAAVVALPLTASITYAASEAPAAPAAPAAPSASIAPPAPPAPPAAPVPPVAPVAPLVSTQIGTVDPDAEASSDEHRSENVFVVRTDDGEDGHRVEERRIVIREGGEGMSDEEIEEIMIEVREGLDEAHRQLEDLPAIIQQSFEGVEGMHGEHVVVEMSCDQDGDEVAETTENADGTQTVKICRTRIMAQAAEGLREARDEIANDTEMDPQMRERILETLDRQLERWESDEG